MTSRWIGGAARVLVSVALWTGAPHGLPSARAGDGSRPVAQAPAGVPATDGPSPSRDGAAGIAGATPPVAPQPAKSLRPRTERQGSPSRPSGPKRPSSPWSFAVSDGDTAQAVRIVLGLTVLAILPALVVSLTSFLRIVIVLSMLRHAIGMNETPPNMVLTGLALFLTLFTMSPVLHRIDEEALRPFMRNELSIETGYEKGMAPLREFMLRQTRDADLAFLVELSRSEPPRSAAEIGDALLVPAFMLSELRAAFQIGFVVFLPFLLIDLVVSSVLMSLGMMMMPPTTVSLPLKILMFVLVDGWSLLLRALVGSFR